MILGRDAEREAIAGFADDVPTGPTAVLLEGEPGIGKSALWADGLELARTRGYHVLSCRPSGSDASLSLVGLGDLFQHVPAEVFSELPDPQRANLEIALLRRPRGPRRVDPRSVSVATLGVLQTLADDAPLVLAVDDIQWLDMATSRILAFVLRRLSDEHIGFLLARTDPEAPAPIGLSDALAASRVRRCLVGPMTSEELATLVGERVGVAMSMAEARKLATVSGGNPFFALEIALAMARGDQGVTGQSLPIPRSLRDDLVAQRLNALPQATREVLVVAASTGRPTLELLRSATEGPLFESLQHALDAGIARVVGEIVQFTHPLYRSAIYASASRARRHEIHRRLADLVVDLEERARHLALSADPPDEYVAGILEEAAALARDRGAPDPAAELLEHAIRLTPTDSAATLRRRHLEAIDHSFVAGETAAAELHARAALEGSPPGAERRSALRWIAAIELERGAIADAHGSLESALAEASGDDQGYAEILRDLAEFALRRGDLTSASVHARSAVEHAERAADGDLLVSSRTIATRIGLLRGDADRPPPPTVSTSGADRPALSEPLQLLAAEAEMISAEHQHARQRLERLERAASDRGDERTRRIALVRQADVEIRDGKWQRARSLAERAQTLALRLELSGALESGLIAYIDAVSGREDEARVGAARGLQFAGDDRFAQLWNLGALGVLELSLGRADLALRHLRLVGGFATEMALGEPAFLPFIADEPEALIATGEHEGAARRIDWLEERGQTLDRASSLAAAAHCRGLLLSEGGGLPSAIASAELAVARYSAIPLPFERGRSLLSLGTLRRRDRQKRGARDALNEALEIFEALGASLWVDRTRNELLRISGRRAASVTDLTESEARVVRLAASGRTNREIARDLSMSVRTVEGHLSHAYAKLGLRSRTELAVFLERSD